MRSILLSAVAVAIVALYATPAAAQTTNQGTAEIQFEDQTMEGSSVTIARVTLPQGGFVVVHDMSQATQDPNQQDPNQQDPNQDGQNTTGQSILGSSEYLEAGTHQDVQVTITTETTGTGTGDNDTGNDTGGGTGTTGTGTEMTLTAVLHLDTNNNQQFDGEDGGQEDGPYTENGGTVSDEARVTMGDQGTGGNQTGDDGLDQPGDDGFGDGQDDDPVDEEEDTPGLGAVALLAVVGAVAALRRR